MKLRIVAFSLCLASVMGRASVEAATRSLEDCANGHCDDNIETTAAIAHGQDTQAAGTDETAVRGTFEGCRNHCEDDPEEQDVEIDDEEETAVKTPEEEAEEGEEEEKQFSNVECRPDDNGLFGDMYESRSIITYAFGLETRSNELDEMVAAVTKSVENMLIENFFDDECSVTSESGIVGFRFEPEDDLFSVSCTPLVSPNAACRVFEVLIEVFGDTSTANFGIVDHINADETRNVHSEILRLYAASFSTADPNAVEETQPPIIFNPNTEPTPPTSSKSGGLKSGAIAGIVISLMVFMLAIVGFLYFEQRRRRRTGDSVSSVGIASKKETASHDSDARSIISQDLGSLPTVGIEGGRPVYVENYLPRAEL